MNNTGRLALAFLLLLPAARAAEPAPNWQRLSPEKFRQLPEVNARIDFARYNRALMAAAIFHETNRARRQLRMRAFQHLPGLDEAADIQAGMGSFTLEVSHRNPIPSLAPRPGPKSGPAGFRANKFRCRHPLKL